MKALGVFLPVGMVYFYRANICCLNDQSLPHHQADFPV
jgi:hypothetical protein